VNTNDEDEGKFGPKARFPQPGGIRPTGSGLAYRRSRPLGGGKLDLRPGAPAAGRLNGRFPPSIVVTVLQGDPYQIKVTTGP